MVCPVEPTIVTFAPATTAPVASVTVPTMLPVETVVWANEAEDNNASVVSRTSQKATRAANRWEAFRFITSTILFGEFAEPCSLFAAPSSHCPDNDGNQKNLTLTVRREPNAAQRQETLPLNRSRLM